MNFFFFCHRPDLSDCVFVLLAVAAGVIDAGGAGGAARAVGKLSLCFGVFASLCFSLLHRIHHKTITGHTRAFCSSSSTIHTEGGGNYMGNIHARFLIQ